MSISDIFSYSQKNDTFSCAFNEDITKTNHLVCCNCLLHKIFQTLKTIEETQKHEYIWIKSGIFTINNNLIKIEKEIMSKITEFADKQNAFNDRIDTAITGLQGDVKSLNDLIVALQATQGQITPEDQALLDQIEVRANTIATKLEALDALTPPVAPPVV